ncbi:MAG TPA: histidine kinase [Candidatus Dormibacteraeota bacterium]|nr:histidine kinase [Candidatus Dormibacteraeota bacterium]
MPRFHGVLGILLREGRSIRVADIRDHASFSWYPEHHPEMAEFLGVPIRHRGQTLGELYLSGTPEGSFSARDQELVEMLASHAGVAIATARLYAESQDLAIMEERHRVARELHDAASQTLFSMVYEARAAALEARAGTGDAAAALERLHDQAAATLAELRGMVYALRPKSLERDGLAATLADHAESLRRGREADLEFRAEGHPELSLEEELALLRIGQEAMHNAVRHGRGAPVRGYLRAWRGGTELSVRDEGPGFDLDTLPRTVRTMGLSTMSERAAAVNAAFTLDTAPGRGTEVRVFLPARRAGGPRPAAAARASGGAGADGDG